MKNIDLVVPKINEYSYKQKLENDPLTMNYNAGYDVSYKNYHYDTGCIDFSYDSWLEKYYRKDLYFAYIKDCETNTFIGYVNYQYDPKEKIYTCGILIEYTYRHKGYSQDALKLLVKVANKNGIKYLYDFFEKDRKYALKTFLNIGFEIQKETTWKKFNKEVPGVILKINTNKSLPNTTNIKTINDVFEFMKNNIRYGWIDINQEIHIANMKNFRKLYKTMSLEEILSLGIGTCIDQVKLMKYLLDKINIKSKMFATRIYEPNDFSDLEASEHMHCFILCYIDGFVYHLEHPNYYRLGIYKYPNESIAIRKINKYYIDLSGGIPRPVTEFYQIKDNITFKQFNNYLNNLNITFRKLRNNYRDFNKIYTWCSQKHVYTYFEQRKLSPSEITRKYQNKLKSSNQELYIIRSNKVDIGLIQIYKYNNDLPNYYLHNKLVYEYDLFIGNKEYLNNNIGRKVIDKINKKIYKQFNPDIILLRVSTSNKRAIKCYLNSNFKILSTYESTNTINEKEIFNIMIYERSNNANN